MTRGESSRCQFEHCFVALVAELASGGPVGRVGGRRERYKPMVGW